MFYVMFTLVFQMMVAVMVYLKVFSSFSVDAVKVADMFHSINLHVYNYIYFSLPSPTWINRYATRLYDRV